MKKILLLTSLVSFLLIPSCKKDNPVDPFENQDKIETGPMIDVSTTSIGAGGGAIKVSKPGTPLDGMEITIPSNSFSTTKNFKISYSEIKSHKFGQNFSPISPMISVTYEGGYSNDGMSVKIPITLPAGHFAMGFLYDDKTGKIEGMPIESLDNNFITINTRHFSTPSTLLTKSTGTNDGTSIGNMIISSISESVLSGKTIISSGFTPGVDDWEFGNYGSYITPIGHCAGQSISAMWYYYEKKLKGAPKLFHRFDDCYIPGDDGDELWMDNRNGYRFASMVQKSIDWDGMIRKIFLKWRENPKYHFLSWKAFALSMLITGEPQYVGLEGVAGAHAIIAHKISITENKLYVTDPSFPGQEKVIIFNGNTFDPYITKQNINTPAEEYTDIGYFSKTSLVDWSTVSQLYNDLENGKSGDAKFPSYSLFIKEGVNTSAFNDGVVLDKDTLNIINKSTDCAQYLSGTDHLQFISIYDATGKYLASGDHSNKGIATLKLKPGANKIGLYIMGTRNNENENYVDFKWVTVNYISLEISPNPITGTPGVAIKITANTNGTAPSQAKYVWNFGDGTPQVTNISDSTVNHTFSTNGTYTVSVQLKDKDNNLLATASSQAVISSGTVTPKFAFLNVEISFEATDNYIAIGKYHPTDIWGMPLPILRDTSYSGTDTTSFGIGIARFPITMTGNSFTGYRQDTVNAYGRVVITIWSFSGSYNPIAKTASITCNYSYSGTEWYNTYTTQGSGSCSANGVPFHSQQPHGYYFQAKSLAACTYASGVTYNNVQAPIPPLGVTESGIGITRNLTSFFCSARSNVSIGLYDK